jgi:hypothetical protein
MIMNDHPSAQESWNITTLGADAVMGECGFRARCGRRFSLNISGCVAFESIGDDNASMTGVMNP